MSEFSDIMDKISMSFKDIDFEALAKKSYQEDREYPENFSNWYPHIKDFGYFKTAEIISNQILTFEETEVLKEEYPDKVDWDKLNKILEPTTSKMKPNKLYNLKNGCFSNKFDFDTCIVTKENIARKLYDINYMSSMYGTGGFTEVVVREYLPYDSTETPTIYNGMPLREEIRVFYNMDTKEIEYMIDYWDYNYCYKGIHTKTDKIVFDYFHNQFGNKIPNHQDNLYEIKQEIENNINTLEFDDELKGIWSIDFMYIPESLHNNYKGIYLIDMARGYRSAYWDPSKLKSKEIDNEEKR